MAQTKGAGAPSSVAEGLQGIAVAVNAAMMAPDAGTHMQLLDTLQKIVLGALHGPGKGGAQPGAGGRPGMGGPMGGAPGGINQLQGAPPSGPSAGMAGGPTPSGASADDVRRYSAQAAGMPG